LSNPSINNSYDGYRNEVSDLASIISLAKVKSTSSSGGVNDNFNISSVPIRFEDQKYLSNKFLSYLINKDAIQLMI